MEARAGAIARDFFLAGRRIESAGRGALQWQRGTESEADHWCIDAFSQRTIVTPASPQTARNTV